jgi:hypothetical protein
MPRYITSKSGKYHSYPYSDLAVVKAVGEERVLTEEDCETTCDGNGFPKPDKTGLSDYMLACALGVVWSSGEGR